MAYLLNLGDYRLSGSYNPRDIYFYEEYKGYNIDFGGVLGTDANNWTKDQEVLNRTALHKETIEDIYWTHWDELKVGKKDLSDFLNDVAKISKIQ